MPNGRNHISMATLALKVDEIEWLDVKENTCPPVPHTRDYDMDKCLARFYADKIGCSSPWEDTSFISLFPFCDTAYQYKGGTSNTSHDTVGL